MNVKRFTARTSREALNLVRQAFGEDAVVLSTRPSGGGGVEVLAMAPEGIGQIEKAASTAPVVRTPEPPAARPAPAMANAAAEVSRDVEALAMSTLSFQDYVRDRMLKRRAAEREAQTGAPAAAAPAAPVARPAPAAPPMLREEIRYVDTPMLADTDTRADAARREQAMMAELRAMKGLIEDRFGALAFMEKLNRSPKRAALTQRLLDAGFSPALIRKLAEGLAADCADEAAWAAGVLERNLHAAEREPALEDAGGVYAIIGATGVGKTTSTAKIAAAFATQHGSGNLGLVTLDAYRVGAQEQLRTYGRILGVPVHTAHDRASLEDLLDLLSAKKMVLIDTAGMGQRDARTRELLEMLSHRAIQKLLVVNAAAQGETIEDVMISYHAAACRGVVLSKIDEAVKIGPALDAIIRHKQRIVGVANGQRVPEDWHRLSGQALVQRALRAQANPSWKLDAAEVNLMFAGVPGAVHAAPAGAGFALHA
ncbi:MAG: flagellar biosynthesis protein FlhF [Aquincola sp.]|nr:flagellar biosynthesis protein FlhF [Aquincola sp.]MDH4289316.1 flagellar biosynthesis protein FlhF [Aquincola sp.]MDH5329084.1 flagellar biosynthesis protein FlhF [Aquincola sp.]